MLLRIPQKGQLLKRAAGLLGLAALVAAQLPPLATAQDRNLVTMSYGSATDKIINAVTYDKMAAEGYKITYVPMLGEAGFARLQAESARPTIDLYHFSGHELQAKDMGLAEDLGDLGGADVPAAFRDPDNKWVGFALSPIGILYDKSKMKTPPKSWSDLLKPEYKGKVAVPTLSNFIGAPFLVKLSESLGGSIDNMDPAFNALAKMSKDGLQFFDKPVSLQTFFSGGDVWMVPYDASNAYRLEQLGLPVGFAIPDEGTTAVLYTKVIAKGAPNADVARKAVAQFLSPEAQISMARTLRWSPVNTNVVLPDDLKDQVLNGGKLKEQVRIMDQSIIRKRLPDWVDRYNREVTGR